MKMYVVGVPCSGKSTICKTINRPDGLRVIDVDDELIHLNGGSWPSVEDKNAILFPEVMTSLLSMDDVLVFNSFLEPRDAERLRSSGYEIGLLAVGEDELRRRHEVRFQTEGWTNVEWFEWNQRAVQELREAGCIDRIIDAERSVDDATAELLNFFQ